MEENNFIWRDEYEEKIKDLVDSGKLPKSYRSAVQWALKCIHGVCCRTVLNPTLSR